MPYINQQDRKYLEPEIHQLTLKLRELGDGLDGNCNYVVSRIVAGAFKPFAGPWRYYMIARVMGVFVCAALEFYRRIGAKREDEVIKINGDIPEYQE